MTSDARHQVFVGLDHFVAANVRSTTASPDLLCTLNSMWELFRLEVASFFQIIVTCTMLVSYLHSPSEPVRSPASLGITEDVKEDGLEGRRESASCVTSCGGKTVPFFFLLGCTTFLFRILGTRGRLDGPVFLDSEEPVPLKE